MSALVTAAVVENEAEAEIAVSLLRSEGIVSMWRKADYAAATFWTSAAGALIGGPVEVLVGRA